MQLTESRQIHIGPRFVVARAQLDGRSVIVKTVRPDRPEPLSDTRLRNELALLNGLRVPGVVEALALEEVKGRCALILADAGSTSLDEWLRRHRPDAGEFLELAAQMASIVASVHAHDVLHRDLSPGNFVLDEQGTLTLIDFDLAMVSAGPTQALAGPDALEAALSYLAPEQTGRVTRAVDQRADLYALGAVFYEMLLGMPPFSSNDPLEVIHGHLAQTPNAPHAIRPELPTQLSEIVMKLLQKMPEWRYQTAESLLADLEEAQRRWLETRQIAPFELAQRDRRELSIPNKAFGREREIAALKRAFSRAEAGGNETVLIEGLAGSGKTVLANALRAELETVWFGVGKCDQLAGNTPFAPFRQAILDWTRDLLSLDEPAAAEWRARIGGAIAPNGRVLTEVVPELAQFLGDLPPLARVGAVEAANRALLTLLSLLRALAQPERPLVLFLDDLQWSDPGSLRLVERIGSDPDLRHVLLLLAWRSEEVSESHPAARAVTEMRKTGAHVTEVPVGPLDASAVTALLSETLSASQERCRQLGAILTRKTGGSPFFVQRLLRLLHVSDCLIFDSRSGAWTWDLARVANLPAPQDVVDLLAASIRRLPSLGQEAMAVAACIGNRFDVGLLRQVLAHDDLELTRALSMAVREVLIVPSGEYSPVGDTIYRFVHDRVQQAAYALISEERRRTLHLAIGRRLHEARAARELSEHVFETVDQLNRGVSAISDPAECLLLLELNEHAARKAKTAAAYGASLAYFRYAIALLPEDAWEARYDVAFRLHREAAELAFVVAERTTAEALSEAALTHARTRLERATIYTLRTNGYTLMREFMQAVGAGQECLRLFHLDLLAPEPEEVVRTAFAEVERRLAGRAIGDLLDAPAASDPEQIALQRIISELLPLTYQWDPRRYAMIVMWGVNVCLEYGHSVPSSHIYVSFALDLIGRGQLERGYAFGRLAVDLARKVGAMETRSLFVFSLFVHHWRAPFRTALPLARAGVTKGVEHGDFLFASFGHYAVADALWASGANLDGILTYVDECIAFGQKISSRTSFDLLLGMRQTVLCLRGNHPVAESAKALLESMKEHPTNTGMYASMQLWASYLLGEFEHARAMTELARAHVPFYFGSIEHAHGVFHGALALAACADRATGDARDALIGEIVSFEASLSVWAENCPDNFRHQHQLVQAELARLRGEPAERLYHQAIDGAAREGIAQDEAVALELCARYCRAQGQSYLAAQLFASAMEAYGQWGATAKVELLQSELSRLELRRGQRWRAHGSSSGQAAELDLLTVFKAAESLSSEVGLDRLIEKMMRMCVETSGAQRATLLAPRDGVLRVQSHFDAESNLLELNPSSSMRLRDVVSESIVNHTLRTGNEVVLGNAAESGPFTDDPHVLSRSSKSILSIAVRHRDRVTAVLFLENELSTEAFTHQRLEMLRLLLAQAAISLENARLYDSLRANEALLRDFIEGMPVGVFVLDREGRPVLANRRAEELIGKPFDPDIDVDDLVTSYQLYVANTDEPYPTELLPVARALRGESTMADDVEIHRADRKVPLAAWGTPIRDEDGSVRYALVAFQDVSEQRAMLASRAQLEEQLYQAQRLEAIGRLAGGVAHDFNNLLTPILAYSELSATALAADSPVRKQILAVHDAAEQAAALTRQLLAFGRQQSLEPRVLDLNEALRSFAPLFRRLVREDIVVEQQLHPELGKVLADPAQLQRVFMNLGLNAADAMPQGGRVRFETENLGQLVILRVSDTGPGMSKETLAKIFDPFFTTKEHGKGTGLGLPTVYGIVTQHEGRLEVRSELGKGTTFEVLLPRAEDDVPSEKPGEPVAPERTMGHGETILVVDDNDAVRTVVEDTLVRGGYRVLATVTPLEALQLARTLGDELDLLITDVVMPGMSGNELASTLKRELPKLSILLISGYSDEVLAVSLGDDIHVLRKPLRMEPLLAKVNALLDRK